MKSRLPFYQTVKETNPDFVIKAMAHPDGFELTLIDESPLFAGSKQRMLSRRLLDIPQEEVIYAGSAIGYAQVALAYCCHLAGKQAVIFVDADKDAKAPLTEIANLFGARIFYFDPSVRQKRLQYIQKQAQAYQALSPTTRCLLPFGLHEEKAMGLYKIAFQPLKDAITTPPKRLWVTAGSGLIFTTLSKLFPTTPLMIVQVGKKIWPDQLEGIHHRLFVSPYDYTEDVRSEEAPPYDTLLHYDAKVWPFVLAHGEPGDFIWNTAGKPRSFREVRAEKERLDEQLAQARLDVAKVYESAQDMSLPLFRDALPPAKDMFNTLKQAAHTMAPATCVHRNFTADYTRADGISNHFTERERMRCIVNRGEKKDMFQYWTNRKPQIVREAIWLGSAEKPAWRSAMTQLKCYECNTFNPFVLTNVIKKYFAEKPISILDPSMGWGDRLIAALAMNCQLYVGVDPNKDLHPQYKKIIASLANDTEVVCIPDNFSLEVLPKKQIGEFDLALTSPPFYNQELYSHSRDDAALPYTKWIDSIYTPYLKDMMQAVKPGGIIAVYIHNVPRIAPLADDTNRLLRAQGATFLEQITFQNDFTHANGLVRSGYPKPLWIYQRPGPASH